jgi:Phage integrase, N-terminal SAM-like domain
VSTRTNRVALEPDLGGIRRLAESFEIGLAARNLSPRTVKGYLESVRLLAGYLARSGMPTRLDSIAREHVEAFVAAELERVSPTSVHIRYRGLQGFFKWAVSDGEIAVSPMISMRPPIVPEKPVALSPTNSDLRRVMYQAMMFAAAASAAAIAAGYASASGFPDTDTYRYAREIVSQIFNVYALRMAAVFLVSQATLLLRTGVIHRWLAFLTYPVALVLLFIVTRNAGVLLVFPRGCSWKHLHPRRPSRRPWARLWTKDRVGRRTHALGFPTPSACFTPMLLAAIDAGLALAI